MKKLLLFLLLFTGLVNAQIVNIPDANLRYSLLYGEGPANTLSTIVITNIFDIEVLTVDSNADGQIQVSEALQIKKLTLIGNSFTICITSLEGLTSFTNLEYLNFSFNLMENTDIDLTPLVNLKEVNASNTLIPSLNVSNLIHLEKIDCYETRLNSVNLENLPSLKWLDILKANFQSIDLSGAQNLQTLFLNSNPNLNNVNVNGLQYLTVFSCSGNDYLSSLDVSTCYSLTGLECDSNNLTYLNIKNGSITELNFAENPNLQYICADIGQVADVEAQINFYGYINCTVNSYCSFTPGGQYNTILGNLKLDSNNNGCDADDLSQLNIRVNINDGTNTSASFTGTTGDYKFYTQAGSFVITPEIENPTWFNFTPATATIPFADNNNNTATQDFCISANGVHHDLEVVLAPITPARPGFDATYKLVYKNKGNQTLSGAVNLVFDDSKIDFVSAIPAVDNLAVNSLTWNYTNFLPFESRSVAITLNINSPVDIPAVNIGNELTFTASITPMISDNLPLDNTFNLKQTVVGSFDPNDITCLEGNSVAPSEIGKYLHYVINFENTGNFPAENIVVKTIVDPAKFDINSLQLLNTSNPVDARITGNVVEFIFEDIQLAGPGGHGHVLLKIKSKSTLVTGDNVAKSAGIYFDYNAPVDTGMVTTVFQSLSNSVFEKDTSINVSPNPTNGNVNVNSNFNIKSIALYDVQGRVLQTILNANKLDISEKANGIYFLKINTEKGSKIEKIIKE